MHDTPRPLRALVVDDDDTSRRLIRAALEARGFLVDEAADGRAGIQQARALPDVVVCDVVMPVLDGYAMCRALRADPATRALPVVFVTASDSEDAVLGAIDAGGDDYIAKPFLPAVLAARIESAVKIRQAEYVRLALAARASNDAGVAAIDDAVLRGQLEGIGCIAAGLAHEMNSPLGVLTSTLHFLRDISLEIPTEDVRADVFRHVDDARQSAAQLAELVRRMAAVSGLDEGFVGAGPG